MTTVQPLERSRAEESTGPEGISDIFTQLQRLLESESSVHAFLRQFLPLVAERFGSLYGLVNCEFKKQPITMRYEARPGEGTRWSSKCQGLILEARYRQTPSAKWIRPSDNSAERVAFTVPIMIPGQGTLGAIVLIGSVQDRHIIESQLVALQSLIAVIGSNWASSSAKAGPSPSTSDGQDQTSLQKIASYETFSEFAYAFTNSLKARLNCEQVAFAWIHRHRPHLVCVSGFDRVQRSTPGIELIEQAMSEAMDASHPIASRSSRANGEAAEPEFLLHRKWRERSGATLVATLPLKDGDQVVGLLSIRDRREQPLNQAQLNKTQEILQGMVPGMCLLRRADRTLLGHVTSSAKKKLEANRLLNSRYRYTVAAVLLTAIALFGFGKFPHTVVAPCEFAPSDHIALTSPTNAKLDDVHVAAGDVVRQGDVVATLDTEELIAERDSLACELASLRAKQFQALEASDVAEASRLEAETRAVQARIATNRWLLDHAEIRAPMDGVVLADLGTSLIGSMLATGQPLMEIVPLGRFKIQIEVDAKSIGDVKSGQAAEIISRSHPDTQLACVIDSVEYLVGEHATGRKVRVHATLQDPAPAWVRVGTPGLACVRTGDRAGWWIALHRTIDQLRLQAWRFSS